MSSTRVLTADTSEELRRCFPIIAQLRPALDLPTFLERVAVQQKEGYALALLEEGAEVAVVAGFRFLHCLPLGKFMYIDDFVTHEKQRGRGLGAQLFSWLENKARQNGCSAIQLDSGTQREAAQRFYAAMKMNMTCNHFTKML
jgi:GNAT superfamily N-acetyltransferase